LSIIEPGALPLTSANLQHYLDRRGIAAVILPMARHTPTVPEAAAALGVPPEQIIKSLVFLVKDEPVLVINNGVTRVDYRKLATFWGVGRKKIKFATAQEALVITGYVIGSMPPFGHRQTLPTVVDAAIPTFDVIYGGGGDINAMLRLTSAELLRVTSATVAAVSE
jgi:Cys-tRNA(Pro) deacylase